MKITSTISWSPFFSSNPMIIMGHTIKKTYSCTPSSWRSAWMCHYGTMESRLRQCHHELHLLQVATRQGPRILGMGVASGHPWAQRNKNLSGISKRRWGLMTNHEKRDELMWHELQWKHWNALSACLQFFSVPVHIQCTRNASMWRLHAVQYDMQACWLWYTLHFFETIKS